MRRRLVSIALPLLAAIAACSVPTPIDSANPAPMHAPGSAWIPFRWSGAEIGGRHEPRAGLLVPVTLEGISGEYYLQLDTGAGWPRWYEVPMRQLLPHMFGMKADTAPDELVLRGRIGAVAMVADTFLVEKGFGDALPAQGTRANVPVVIGTLGLRFFRQRLLVIDFPNERISIAEGGRDWPEAMPGDVEFVPARYAHGHFFVPFAIGGRTVDDFFFDSGASSLPLSTSMQTWRQLTGRTGAEHDTGRVALMSWGKALQHVTAPAEGDVSIGGFRFPRPLVLAQVEQEGQRDFFATSSYPVGGLIGNALFFDRHMVVVDVAGRRFGIAVSR